MALQATRIEYRIALSHVDRGVEHEEALIAAQHPSETVEHLTLRVLGWCLLYEPGLAFGPGLSTPDAADLWAHDLTGRLTTWVECGAAAADKLRKVVQHHPDARVHAVFDEPRRAAALFDEIAGWRPRDRAALTVWTVDAALVRELAARAERRQRWAVTVVGDHLYVDDSRPADGAVVRQNAAV
jgi:uncharacterized protein YaeQ